MVDARLAEVFERQIAELYNGRFGVERARAHPLEQLENTLWAHGPVV